MDANLSKLLFQEEDTWGVVPVTPALEALRFTSETLSYEKESVSSEEVRSDRQKAAKIKVFAQASGGFAFELSYTQSQRFMKGALYADPLVLAVAAVECDINHTTGVVTAANGTFDNAVVGSFIRVEGATTPANNGIKRVTAKAGNGSSITCAAGSFTVSDADVSLTISSTVMKNGVTPQSYIMERQVPKSGGGTGYERFHGMQPDTYNLSFVSKEIVTGEIGFIGAISANNNASFNGVTPITPAPTDQPVNGTNNMGLISLNGATSQEKFRRITMAIANGVRGRDALGTEGNWSLGIGTFAITGEFDAYYRDDTLKDAVRNHTNIALAWVVTDKAGNSIGFHLPCVSLDAGDNQIEGINTDVMVPLTYEAIMDPVLLCTAIVSYIPAATP